MTAVTLIYLAVSLSALLSAGTLIAFFWCERRARTHERAMAQRLADLYGSSYTVDRTGGVELAAIPIKRRPFHEALEEDAPELAPSPRAVAISRELLAQRRSAICNATSSYEPEALPSQPRPSLSERAPALSTVHEDNDEMLKQQMAAAAVAFGALTACQPMKRPEYQQNPNPKERYEITMTIQDAPGPLTRIGGAVQYSVDNWVDCMPEKFDLEVGPHHEQKFAFLPLSVVREADNAYRMDIAVDALLNEDYHDRGVCQWELTAVTTRLLGRTVRFTPTLFLDELRAQKPKTIFFSKRTYLSMKLKDWPDSGETSPSGFGHDVQDELFTITLTPRRIRP